MLGAPVRYGRSRSEQQGRIRVKIVNPERWQLRLPEVSVEILADIPVFHGIFLQVLEGTLRPAAVDAEAAGAENGLWKSGDAPSFRLRAALAPPTATDGIGDLHPPASGIPINGVANPYPAYSVE
jgi:hypothetical protein